MTLLPCLKGWFNFDTILFFCSLLESNHVDVAIKSLGILRNLLTEKEVSAISFVIL